MSAMTLGRKWRRNAAVILLGMVVTAGAALLVVTRQHPTDAALTKRFYDHASEFEILLRMAQEDGVDQVFLADFDRRFQARQSPIASERRARYKSLLRTLALIGVVRHDGGNIVFLVSLKGISISASRKGYVFTEKAVAPVVDSLDERDASRHGHRVVYRALTPNWYLYLQ
jgi:hypothetical protein